MRLFLAFYVTCCCLALTSFSRADGQDGEVVRQNDGFSESLLHAGYDLEESGLTNEEVWGPNSAQFFLDQLNETCVTAEHLQNYSYPVAIKILTHFLQLNECEEFSADLVERVSVDKVCPEDFAKILSNIRTNNDRIPYDYENTCFASGDIILNCKTDANEINEVYLRLVVRLMTYNCILPDSRSFVDGIFSMYEAKGENLTKSEFGKLLLDLKIGEIQGGEEDHHGEEAHAEEDHGEEGDHAEEEEEHAGEEDHGEEENHDRRKRSEDDHHEEAAVVDKSAKCYSSEEYISMALNDIGADSHDKTVVSKEAFAAICPALVQQVISGACQPEAKAGETGSTTPEYTKAQKYGYGTAAVFIISLLAFVGLTVFRDIGKERFKMLMQFFVALGIGTLSGDAILHLIPEIVGLHGHEAGAEHAHEEEEEEDKTHVWRLLVVIGGVYLFYLFENLLKLWNEVSGSNITFHAHPEEDGVEGGHHNHNHHGNENDTSKGTRGHRMTSFTVKNANAIENDDGCDVAENGHVESDVRPSAPPPYDETNNQNNHGRNTSKEPIFWGITPVGIMVWVGDALHNFGDGIALGAAFSSSWVSGVGTSIAIFCHELPHEFGDFAIYLQNGMSKWKALFLNFVAACFAFIGLYVGLALGEQGEAREWMLAVISGMFLYISLVDIMHEMIGEKSQRPILLFFVQNLGLLLGWAILLLLALYEEDLINALQG